MGLGQEANNIRKELYEGTGNKWIDLIVYGLLLLFLIGGAIYTLGSWTESPADTTESAEQSEKKTLQKETVKAIISDNYYFNLPDSAELKSEKEKDDVITKTYYFFGKGDKNTLFRITSEKDDGEFPQVVWNRYKGGESEVSYVMFFDTAAAIHQEKGLIEIWWPDGGNTLCHVRLTGKKIDGYEEEILNMIRKKNEPDNKLWNDDAGSYSDDSDGSAAPPGAMEEYNKELIEDAQDAYEKYKREEEENSPKDPFGG